MHFSLSPLINRSGGRHSFDVDPMTAKGNSGLPFQLDRFSQLVGYIVCMSSVDSNLFDCNSFDAINVIM